MNSSELEEVTHSYYSEMEVCKHLGTWQRFFELKSELEELLKVIGRHS